MLQIFLFNLLSTFNLLRKLRWVFDIIFPNVFPRIQIVSFKYSLKTLFTKQLNMAYYMYMKKVFNSIKYFQQY